MFHLQEDPYGYWVMCSLETITQSLIWETTGLDLQQQNHQVLRHIKVLKFTIQNKCQFFTDIEINEEQHVLNFNNFKIVYQITNFENAAVPCFGKLFQT